MARENSIPDCEIKQYLGLRIVRTPQSLYSLNYTPLITKIVKDLETWKNLPISLLGRAHLFKMNSFAKLLFPLQTLPLQLQTSDIRKLNIALTHFLWQRKRAKIALSKLWLPKSEGGLNLSNIKIYN